jgi:tRNA-specific 2-thiouridylase
VHHATAPGGRHQLLRGLDVGKDQSYFLHRLSQTQLARTLFPLGELQKSAVREIARDAGLANHAKKDSTGICFIGERPFRDFLARYLPRTPGPMLTPEGKRVGEHMGLSYYTIGQRQGLGIGGKKATSGAPNGEAWFVADKRMQENTLIVVQGHDHPLLLKNELRAADLAWIDTSPPDGEEAYGAKTRYRQQDADCRIGYDAAGALHVRFAQPQRAVTPGQSVVLYHGEVCLGGGIIQ